MIKLKNIINEIDFSSPKSTGWTSKPGMPDDVIDFLHKLIAELMSVVGKQYTKYLEVKKFSAFDVWLIINKYNDAILTYSPKEDMWFIRIPGATEIKKLSKDDLEIVIKNWAP
jgi:hypothetical protein